MTKFHYAPVYLHTGSCAYVIHYSFFYFVFRLYIKGPKLGTSDVFVDNLPGYPDNIKKNTRGNFYVGMASVRFDGASPIGSFLDIVGPYPSLKRFIAKVMYC